MNGGIIDANYISGKEIDLNLTGDIANFYIGNGNIVLTKIEFY